MTEETFYRNFIDISEMIQTEFERNVNKYGEKIKCRKGCSKCCSQIFNITYVDSFVIRKFMDSLSVETKIYLKEKARNYLEAIASEQINEEFFSKPKLPCPALNEVGSCLIYEARPVICRRFGPPVYDYKNPDKIVACDLNFKDGEEIIDNELIPNQIKIGKRWDELKTKFNIEHGLNAISSTTIAEAILNSS